MKYGIFMPANFLQTFLKVANSDFTPVVLIAFWRFAGEKPATKTKHGINQPSWNKPISREEHYSFDTMTGGRSDHSHLLEIVHPHFPQACKDHTLQFLRVERRLFLCPESWQDLSGISQVTWGKPLFRLLESLSNWVIALPLIETMNEIRVASRIVNET